MIAPTLTTERLTLRPQRLEDFAPYAAMWASDASRYMGGPAEDETEAWHFFAAELASWPLQGFGYWAIERQADGAVLGGTGFGQPPCFPERELGWYLYPAHQGRGYASEAARAARDWAAGRRGWDTLVSYIDPDNAASVALAARLGATLDDAAARPDPDDLVFRHPMKADA